eukprot:547454-Lingulodinium_polyedra.AAC.1
MAYIASSAGPQWASDHLRVAVLDEAGTFYLKQLDTGNEEVAAEPIMSFKYLPVELLVNGKQATLKWHFVQAFAKGCNASPS